MEKMNVNFRSVGILLLLALLFSPGLEAQQVDWSKMKGLRFRNIGPAGMSGRVTSIDVVHAQPDVIYVGTASGGVWKSESGGVNWKPIFDKQPVQSIGAVAIDQRNPDIVWAGTGEGNPRNSHNSGTGIFRSLDGGVSWDFMGLGATKAIHRIIIDPYDSDVVYAAAMGSAWGPNPERGVFKTTDGGQNWEKILYQNDTTGCADLIMDPSNPNKLFASMWQFHREPWFFTSGGPGSGLYVSTDGGKSWKKRTEADGLPEGELGRIGLGICHNKPNYVYALVESKKGLAIYRSTDGGMKFRRRGDDNVGNRPFYYADIYVDPENENRIYSLWSYVSRSEDGGRSFQTIADYGKAVHPDHHAFFIHPQDPSFLINGNDGGLNISYDMGDNWRFVDNLPLGQFYHINYDMEVPYNIYGGLQDNGTWRGPSEVWASGGIQNHHWDELMFGDGFDVATVPGNSRFLYAMSQGGYVSLVDAETGVNKMVRPVHPEGQELRFNWNAALHQSSHDSCRVMFGSQFLHLSTDCGDSWKIISPDLTTNDTAKQKQAISGGLTIDATKAENYTTITCISESPLRQGLIWVGTDDGNLHLTTDNGANWENLAKKLPGLPEGVWFPQIVTSPHNEGEVLVVANDYRRNNWEPYLYHSRDYGKSWRRLADSKNIDGYCLAVVQDPVAENLLFLGTDHGLYVSIDYGSHWAKWTEGFPSVPTRDLHIHPREHDLIVGTFGRSIWILDDITPIRELAQQGVDILKKPFHLFPVQNAWNGEIRPTSGGRFYAQGGFTGQNDYRAAKINLWIAAPDKKDKIKVVVFDEEGDTIRHYTQPVDTGLVRTAWGFSRNGISSPSYNDRKRDFPPSGPRVVPGKYTIQVHYKEDSMRSTFEMLADPRLNYSATDLAFREQKMKEFEALVKRANEGFDRLKQARKTMHRIESMVIYVEDSLQDSVKALHTTMRDTVKSLMEIYLTPEGFAGYDHVTVRLVEEMWNTSSYLFGTYGRPGPNALQALDNYRRHVEAALDRINRFLTDDWIPYRKFVEGLEKPLFKDLDPVPDGR